MRGGGGVGHADSDRVTGAVTVHSLHPFRDDGTRENKMIKNAAPPQRSAPHIRHRRRYRTPTAAQLRREQHSTAYKSQDDQ